MKRPIVGSSCIGVLLLSQLAYADSLPTPATQTPVTQQPQSPSTLPAPSGRKFQFADKSKLPATSTSLTVDYTDATPNEPVALLNKTVSFMLKDASFLTTLDTIVAASDKKCRIECRRVKAVKLGFNAKDAKAGMMLDALAKSAGARLYVFPTKLLISPPNLLTPSEQKQAKLFGVLLTSATFPQNSGVGKVVNGIDILDVANTKISVDVGNASPSNAGIALSMSTSKFKNMEFRTPHGNIEKRIPAPNITLSLQDVAFADALSIMAASVGSQLFIMPSMFLVCAPEDMTPEEKRLAVPAFRADSVNISFADPSAHGS